MRPLLFASALPCLLLATPAGAFEPTQRVFGAASGAMVGGMVGGPIGLVAGAAVGYFLSPAVLDVPSAQRRHARRRVRRAPAVAGKPVPEALAQAQPPVYGQPMYGQQAYGQPNYGPVYLAQQAPPPGYTVAPQPYATSQQAIAQGAPPVQVPNYMTAAPQTTRPAMYAPVPPPQSLTLGGNYAPRAYKPQSGTTEADPLH